MIMDIQKFLENAKELESVVESDATWDEKFEIAFRAIRPQIELSGVEIAWFDPDTSYEDDVRAYYNAVKDKADELKKAVSFMKIGSGNRGMKVTLRHARFPRLQILRNVTEIHHNHSRLGPNRPMIVFNSDIHGTGMNYEIADIVEYEAVLEDEIADQF